VNACLLLLLAGVIIVSLLMGSASLSVSEVVQGLRAEQAGTVSHDVMWHLRLPRILLAAIVGMHFAIAGLILQSVIRNPLADPGVIGVSSGASLAVVAFLLLHDLLANTLLSSEPTPTRLEWLPLAALLGGLATAALVLGLSWGSGASPTKLALNGVAIGAILHAAVMWVVVVWGAGRVETSLIWLAGSLYGRDFSHLGVLLPWSIAGVIGLLMLLGPLSLLRFNDDISRALGLNLQLWRLCAIALAVVFAASATAITGPIGFVGLVTPHLARLLTGSDIRYLTFTSLLCGALLLLIADLLGRTLLSPSELPAGALTTLVGIPVFLLLLYRQARGTH